MKKRIFGMLLMGAMVVASMSMFTSCKDYDDDINKNAADITALKAELANLRTQLASDLSAATASLNTAIAAKADAKTVTDLAGQVSDLNTALAGKADAKAVTDLAAEVAGLKAKIDAIDLSGYATTESLSGYATAAKAEELAGLIAALTGKVDGLADAAKVAAVEKNLEIQAKALENLTKQVEELSKKGYDDTAIKKEISDLQDAIKSFAKSSDVTTLTKSVNDLSDKINKSGIEKINVLEALVNKKLTSLVLKPNFYWEGLEAVELPYANTVAFQPVGKYGFKYTIKNVLGEEQIAVTVDNVMAAQLEKARKVGGKDKTYVVLEGSTGTETISNAAGVVATVWPNGGKSMDLASIYNWVKNATDGKGVKLTDLKRARLEQAAFAKYHVNPTTANLEGVKIGFVDNIVPTYTRAAGAASAGIGAYAVDGTYTKDGKINTFANGILTVPFKVDYDKVYTYFQNWTLSQTTAVGKDAAGTNVWAGNPAGYGTTGTNGYGKTADGKLTAELPYIAVSLTATDTTVVSDYAVVVPATYTIVALADTKALDKVNGVKTNFAKKDNTGKIRDNHMYESVGYNGVTIQFNAAGDDYQAASLNYGAITMPATREVAWNDTLTIDGIETHADYTTYAQYGASTKDKALNDDQLAALGLHYEYSLVEYIKGKEVTGESCHMIQIGDKTSNKFSPRQVNEDTGATLNTQNRNTIGREPLVRVDLVDEAGNIVRYGYLKIRIVDTAQQTQDKYVTINFDDMYFNCGDAYKVKWYQMEGKILAILGANGITKQEFEKQYYMEVEGAYKAMPAQKDYTDNGNTIKDGSLYAKANANKWWAIRYYNAGTEAKPDMKKADAALAKWTNVQNWFGHVWYTPHDNATEAQNWDEQTNVIEWNFDNQTAGASNMGTAGYYAALMKAVGATYDTKGLNAKALSTVIRFVNKATGASVWVTLKADVNKLHFAYADINHRVLDHWYSMTKGYANSPEKTDTIEVYANVPTPAEYGKSTLKWNPYYTRANINTSKGLQVADFDKELTEFWLEKKIVVDYHDAAKFGKFTAAGATNVAFKFRLPKAGENADFSAAADGTWTVPGASGTTWTVKLNAARNEIQAVKKGTAAYGPVTICKMSTTGKIEWAGRTEFAAGDLKDNGALAPNKEDVNEPANDILNYIGMYDAAGNNQKDSYLTGQQNKTFAAYVEIEVTNATCYNPLIGKNYFNVRFLRPINVWPAKTTWKDAKNDTEIYDIWKLLNMRDWRTYALVIDTQSQKFDNGTTYKGEYSDANKTVPFSFYGITNLYVERAKITSDAYLAKENRTVLTDPAKIAALRTVDAIPALTGTNKGVDWQYFKLVEQGTTKDVAGTMAKGLDETNSADDLIAYTNNGGVVSTFHIYVPISVEYSFGALKPWTQRVWAVITIDPTEGNED